MNYTALSLSQTPPLSVPLRFFLTAPLFLAVAAIVLMVQGDALVAGRWTTTVLALTHLITLGFLGVVMVGAVQQLLPVLIGTPVPRPVLVSTLLHLPITLGIALLVVGMGWGQASLLQWGTALLVPALTLFVGVTAYCLWRSPSGHATVSAMALAIVGLTLLVAMALWLLGFGGWRLPLAHPNTQLHIAWGVVGWIAALLIGVAYQVVPMFQITPEYPAKLRRWLIPTIAFLLVGWSLLQWWLPALVPLFSYLIALSLGWFAIQTLSLQQQRRRRLSDVTLDFWRVSMASLLLAIILWMAGPWLVWTPLELILGVLFLLGFATSAVNGMLYKIVPFLVWLHLNNRLQAQGSWQGTVPNMKQVIPVAETRRQFRLHIAALIALLAAVIWSQPYTVMIAGGLWLANALYLWWNLMLAWRLYHRHLVSAV